VKRFGGGDHARDHDHYLERRATDKEHQQDQRDTYRGSGYPSNDGRV
jgi:hypothetical protein